MRKIAINILANRLNDELESQLVADKDIRDNA